MTAVAETTVPVLMIAPDWPIDDVQTMEDCEDAHAVLSEQIAHLEVYVQDCHTYWTKTQERVVDHQEKALELRMKKATLAALNNIRGKILREERRRAQETQDRKFIELFRSMEPEAYARVVLAAKQAA